MGGFKFAHKLVPRGSGVWTCDGHLDLGLIKTPVRMTVLAYGSEVPGLQLVVVSPFAPDRGLLDALESLGRVCFILAPNSMHHLGAVAMKDALPFAKLLVSPAVPARSPALMSREHHVVSDPGGQLEGLGWPVGEIGVTLVKGSAFLSELVLLHRRSRTLVVTDLAFNFKRGGALPSFPGPLYLALAGGFRTCCPTQPMQYIVQDAALLAREVGALLEHDFDQVIVAHGEVISTGGKEALRKGTYAWACRLARSRDRWQQTWAQLTSPTAAACGGALAAVAVVVGLWALRSGRRSLMA